MKRNVDFIIGILIMSFALLFFVESFSLPAPRFEPMGMAFVPRLFAILVFVFATKMVFDSRKTPGIEVRLKMIFLYCLTFILYLLILHLFGFFISTFLGLIGMMWVLRQKSSNASWKVMITSAIVTTIVVFIVFNYWLKIILPKGIIFS